MGLSEDLQKKLRKKFEPSSMISMRYKGNDLAIKTDVDGNAVLLFIGERKDENTIKGERYSRRLKLDEDGKVIKDHWERKGKAM
jgi:hypothetical protein